MNKIADRIAALNENGKKALTVFLTAGYPEPRKFTDVVKCVADAGADVIEIGVPFGDSLADGPVVQSTYYEVLRKGVNLQNTLEQVEAIRKEIDIPLVLMSSINPIIRFGSGKFIKRVEELDVNGLILPDLPPEEYADIFPQWQKDLGKILLTTPSTDKERISYIDDNASGFVYAVSVLGTTGVRGEYGEETINNLKRTYGIIEKNKMQVGFGISSAKSIEQAAPFCDGVIVGSAILRKLSEKNGLREAENLLKELRNACGGK